MISHGARNLILISSRISSIENSATFLDEIRETGCNVFVEVCDVTDAASLQSLLSKAEVALPPIKGVIQSAMILKVSYHFPHFPMDANLSRTRFSKT